MKRHGFKRQMKRTETDGYSNKKEKCRLTATGFFPSGNGEGTATDPSYGDERCLIVLCSIEKRKGGDLGWGQSWLDGNVGNVW